MVVVQDAPVNPLRWEEFYHKLTTEDDGIATPATSSNPPSGPTDGLRHSEPRSVIELSSSDEEPPSTRVSRAKAKVIVKQEIIDDDAVVQAPRRGKEVVRPAKDSTISGGNPKVAAKTYRHGDGSGVAGMRKAETILATIADGLSPEAQEKRETSRMYTFRETMDRERMDRATEERTQDLKHQIQGLKLEIGELRCENQHYRDRATEATTMLSILAGNTPMPVHSHPIHYGTPTIPPFAPDPSLYSVPTADHQSTEPEGVTGPGPQTMRRCQQAAEVDHPMITEDV